MFLSALPTFARLRRLFLPHYRSMATAAIGDWMPLETEAGVPYKSYTQPLVKSAQDDRDYRLIQLTNGLQAILVHDAKADKVAASLDVAVGHLSDPDDMPGLAHFCEHLLFMGTQKFPKENEYSEYLSRNNGHCNAFTSTTNTNYYMSVAPSALPGALERFSAFFHCPLFSPSCTSRELNAVDSEHKKNHQSDIWRIFQLNKHLSPPGHVWTKFGSGDRDSLSRAARELKQQGKLVHTTPNISVTSTPLSSRSGSPAPSLSSSASISSTNSEKEADGGLVGRETRRRLIEWWNREYCASRMRLCIVGKESLDELVKLAVTLFSPIPNRGRDPLPLFGPHPYGDEHKGTLVFAQTVIAFHALDISFPLEYQAPLWKYKPITLINHFVAHEGPGSLHSYLKRRHWITALSSGPQGVARGFAMFNISIRLTPEGFANYRSVVLATYKYLALLRSSKFDAFHRDELVQLTHTKFHFLDKGPPEKYANWLTQHMAWPVPHHLFLAAPLLTWAWENEEDRQRGEEKIAEYLESFRVGNSRVVLMAKKEDSVKLQPDLQWSKEPWYGTEYVVQRWDADFIKEADANDISEFFLPGPNQFIPSRLEVDKKEIIEPQKRPHLIRQTPLSTLWHKKDDRFWAPKAQVVINFRSPVVNTSARTAVLTRLYADLVTDSLTEFAYDASLAGLSYNLQQNTTGLYVIMDGYNDKLFLLINALLDKIKTLVVEPQRLEVKKESIRKEFSNFFLGQSNTLAIYHARYLLSETQWTYEEKLTELPTITIDEVQAHAKNFLSQVNLSILVVGNVYKDEAIKIAETAEQGLGQSLLSYDELNERALLLPQGSNFVLNVSVPNPNQANSALIYFTYFGPVADQKIRVTSSLLTQILTEPAFNVLRTREQLGYLVSCTNWTLPGSSERGLRIAVQSEKKPGYLEERVEAFLDEMKDKLETMPDAAFASHQSSLEKKWLERDKNLREELARYLDQVNSGHWDFLRNEKDAALLRTITKSDVLDLFMSKVHPSSQTRSKLSVHMLSQKPRPKLVSCAAAQAFEVLLRRAFPDIDEKAWRTSVEAETPSLVEFGQYWLKVLDMEEGKKVLAQLPALLNEYPVAGEDDDHKRTEVVYIEDRKAFRAGLLPSVNPGPLEQWNDHPQPKT